jgi:hypothetical protein
MNRFLNPVCWAVLLVISGGWIRAAESSRDPGSADAVLAEVVESPISALELEALRTIGSVGLSYSVATDDDLDAIIAEIPPHSIRRDATRLVRLGCWGEGTLYAHLMERWMMLQPAEVLEWLEGLRPEEKTSTMIRQVGIAGIHANSRWAVGWLVSRYQAGETTDEDWLTQLYEATRFEPGQVAELALELREGAQRDALVEHAVQEWAGREPGAADSWVSRFEESPLKQRLIAAQALGMAALDILQATTMAATRLNPGSTQDRVVIALVQRWAQKAPMAAGAWVLAFENPTLRKLALDQLLEQWKLMDPEASARWALIHSPPIP